MIGHQPMRYDMKLFLMTDAMMDMVMLVSGELLSTDICNSFHNQCNCSRSQSIILTGLHKNYLLSSVFQHSICKYQSPNITVNHLKVWISLCYLHTCQSKRSSDLEHQWPLNSFQHCSWAAMKAVLLYYDTIVPLTRRW